jgi:rhodanese-related sulfurtransferase
MERLIEYIGNHYYLAGAAVVVAVLAVIFEVRARAANFAAVGPQDAIRLMNQHALVLDIRPPEQFATGHVTGARNLPPDQILKAGDTLKKYKEKPVVVYCDTGSLSGSAVRQLVAQGFTKAVNLRGGIAGWRAENLPLTKD